MNEGAVPDRITSAFERGSLEPAVLTKLNLEAMPKLICCTVHAGRAGHHAARRETNTGELQADRSDILKGPRHRGQVPRNAIPRHRFGIRLERTHSDVSPTSTTGGPMTIAEHLHNLAGDPSQRRREITARKQDGGRAPPSRFGRLTLGPMPTRQHRRAPSRQHALNRTRRHPTLSHHDRRDPADAIWLKLDELLAGYVDFVAVLRAGGRAGRRICRAVAHSLAEISGVHGAPPTGPAAVPSYVKRRAGRQGMSDQSQGRGWWLASDGKWYPPESAAAPAPAPGVTTPVRSSGEKLVLGGTAGLVIGAFLPWATVGPFDVAGTDGDGVLTLLLGLIVAALAWTRKAPRLVIALIGLAVLIGLYDLVDVGRVAGSDEEFFDVSVGIGLLLTVAASIVAAVGWVQDRRSARDRIPER